MEQEAHTGKYTAVAGQLPRDVIEENGQFQAKLDLIKDAIRSRIKSGATPAAVEYLEARARYEAKKAEADEAYAELAAAEQLMWSAYEQEQLSSLKMVTGETVAVNDEVYARVLSREDLITWALEHGYRSKLSLPWQTTANIVRERLLEGDQIPPCLEARRRPKTSRLSGK